ncbi:MAG: AAA family ATPase [Candidatus Diapherotrites archaeon]|nr:AAA family ATPase [Candidatus Diapherotrites archaeon]
MQALVQTPSEKNIFESLLKEQNIFRDRNAITPHFTPKRLPFRDKQISELSFTLRNALQGKKADNIFVYGKVGTGKTCTVKFVMQQLEAFALQNNGRAETVYVNCRTYNSKYKVLQRVMQKFFAEESFVGFSSSFVFEKLLDYARKNKKHLLICLDEIDKVKDLDDLIYALTRANDELEKSSVSVVGISNNILFKDKLDTRTKSALCELEMVFPPYNAEELRQILSERISLAFQDNVVDQSAINLASAVAARESGDARTAVMLLLRAGEFAEKSKSSKITDSDIIKAKRKVEEELVFNLISTLPLQQQLVLFAISSLSVNGKGTRKITGSEENILFSGDVYGEYNRIASSLGETVVSARWYREYVSELETYGLIITTQSGKGIRGSTRLIKLACDPEKIFNTLKKEIMKSA